MSLEICFREHSRGLSPPQVSSPRRAVLTLIYTTVCSTPVSFWLIEKFGRRRILLCGGTGMVISQYIVGIVGVTAGKGSNPSSAATAAMIAFICINISMFAMTWGPSAWVIVGEIFPLPIRSHGVGLSTASNWFWNCVSLHTSRLTPVSQRPLANMSRSLFLSDHNRDHALPSGHRSRRRQPRGESVLPLGLALLPLRHLHLFPSS